MQNQYFSLTVYQLSYYFLLAQMFETTTTKIETLTSMLRI